MVLDTAGLKDWIRDRVIMVTGDHAHTALAIGREIDLIRGPAPVVLTGAEVRHMSPASLQLALDAPELLFARVSAEQKMLIVQALQQKGEIVEETDKKYATEERQDNDMQEGREEKEKQCNLSE